MRQPIRLLGAALGAAAAIVLVRATWVQVAHADDIASASSLTEQADGGYRFEYNPRLLAAARTFTRGTIYDRNELPLATSRPDEIAATNAAYGAQSSVTPEDCSDTTTRCYPLGGLAFHLLGDWTHQTNWAARNSSFIERDSDARLKGYDDHTQLVTVINPRTGQHQQALHRDFRTLLPLARHRYQPDTDEIHAMRTRDRDVQTSIDARLQMRVAAALREGIVSHGFARGAAVVIDANTGEVLAAASYPWPEKSDIEGIDPDSTRGAAAASATLAKTATAGAIRGTADAKSAKAGERTIGRTLTSNTAAADAKPTIDGREDRDDREERAARWLDRARYGLYPPGSTFKLVIAGIALRTHEDNEHFMCTRLPDGRVGGYIHGQTRPVRDDPMDTVPHGDVDLERGLIVSCNAYFAQLAQALGPRPVLDAASLFQIDVARTPTPEGLRPMLAHVGYGQGEAVVSPLKLARVSAAIASGGVIAPLRWDPASAAPAPALTAPASSAATNARAANEPATGRPAATAVHAPLAALQTSDWPRFLSKPDADRIARMMRAVVTTGTAKALRSHPVAIAGKTGTAEVTGAPAHSWFTGFAPYQSAAQSAAQTTAQTAAQTARTTASERRIAFAVIVENAGYGNRAAAPIAGEIVTAAKDLGLIK